jgi:hypothetical protein
MGEAMNGVGLIVAFLIRFEWFEWHGRRRRANSRCRIKKREEEPETLV